MSTQSANGFEWSIKLMSNSFYAGIASQFKPEEKFIHEYDPTVITFFAKRILLGSRAIHSNLPQPKAGDIIRFQFQPGRKKLVIHLVRHRKNPSINS